MIKSVLLATFVALGASVALATPQDNFQMCASSDPSWMGRWGNYVVAFDRDTAYDTCRKNSWDGPAGVGIRAATCKINGVRISAGFYCTQNSTHR
jgi:hypothetical protein